MQVIKRNGRREDVYFDKITERIRRLAQMEPKLSSIDIIVVAKKVIDGLCDGITTRQLDNLAAETAASMSTIHPEYGTLALRICVSDLHKSTSDSYEEVCEKLYYNINNQTNQHSPLITKEYYDIMKDNIVALQAMLDYSYDYQYEYFGYKALEKAYLYKVNEQIIERPQHMLLRVAVGIHKTDMVKVKESYLLMAQKYFTHASPTLFNACSSSSQYASCFLATMKSDSIDGIYQTLKEAALISKGAGGYAVAIHNIRAKGSYINGTNGQSSGIVPMLRVYNDTARYVDQCVHPETIIYTTDGPAKIQNCVNNQTKIFNLKGEIEIVENVLEHSYDGEIYNIQTMHCIDNLKITGEHPIYVLSGQKKGLNYKLITNRLDKNIVKFEWRDVKSLTTDDFMVYKIPTHESDDENIDQDDCYMYGIVLGDGTMPNNKAYGTITLHKDKKKHILDFAKNYFESKFIEYNVTTEDNTSKIRWNKSVSFPFKYGDVYDDNGEKFINSKWLNLPIEKAKFILKGLIDTDGCDHKELVFDSTSRNLIESVRFFCFKLGLLTSGYIRDRVGQSHETERGIITNKKIAYCLRIPRTKEICELTGRQYNEKSFFKFLRYQNYLLTRIEKITTEAYSGTLYDLQLKDEHNYMLHNGIVHNGGGKRKGAFATYLEPSHPDFEDWLQLKKNSGKEELRCRDLFYGAWIPDLFMKRVENNERWSFFCPHTCPDLSETYGDEYERLYLQYEREGKAVRTVSAQQLWFEIVETQIETGMPYMLYKDSINRKSNQSNLGTIKSSNLCTEIVEYTSPEETAVCTLSSIGLPMHIVNGVFNHDLLYQTVYHIVGNLNKIIDINNYPIPETKNSNLKHRPMGIGVQGLADTFAILRYPFDSTEAKLLNKEIFETIYYAALRASCDLAKVEGPYSTFEGSPASRGILQFDMWRVTPSSRWDYPALKKEIITYGIRNSLLLAPMPTASTSAILGFNECFEPFTSNIYVRRTLAGEFTMVNKYLVRELIKLGLWNLDMKEKIVAAGGTIQTIASIPTDLKEIYRTAWELKMRDLIDMSADRGAFVCQSQSLNAFMAEPNKSKLTSMHFHAWKSGLKTGMYYLRTKLQVGAINFTVDKEVKETKIEEQVCRMDADCTFCSG